MHEGPPGKPASAARREQHGACRRSYVRGTNNLKILVPRCLAGPELMMVRRIAAACCMYMYCCCCCCLAASAPPSGWLTCGGLPDAYNATACPADTASCCHQRWAPGEGSWGCIDNAWGGSPAAAPAVCCENNYTACPAGHSCSDAGHGPMVVTTCVADTPPPSSGSGSGGGGETPRASVLGRQVCKQGAPLPLSRTQPNVLVVGDSVSIGYTPLLAQYLSSAAQ